MTRFAQFGTICAILKNAWNNMATCAFFLRFLSCTNGTKSRKTSHIYLVLGTIIFIPISQKNQQQVKKKLKEMF